MVVLVEEQITDGYCIIEQPGERIVGGPYPGVGMSQAIYKPFRTHAVKVTTSTVANGRVDCTVLTVCGESFNIQGLRPQIAWKDQLLAPVGDRWIGDSAPPCEGCKVALASLEWQDVRVAPE